MFGSIGAPVLEQLKSRDKPREARWEPDRWSRFWETVCAFDGVATLASLTIPAFHLYGTFGRHKKTQAELQLPSGANHTILWLDGAGHYLPQDRPKEVAAYCQQMRELV